MAEGEVIPHLWMVEKDQVEEYLAASLCVSGIVQNSPRLFGEALEAYRHAVADGHYHLPLFFASDLYHLFALGFDVQFVSDSRSAAVGIGNKTLRLRYERECLGRLLQMPAVHQAIEIAATSKQRTSCLQRILILVLRKLAPFYPAGAVQLNPGHLRDLELSCPQAHEIERASDELAADEHLPSDLFFSPLESFLDEISTGLRWSALVREEDLFELAHMGLLSNDHLRIGCRQIISLVRRLQPVRPHEFDLSGHESGEETAFVDETHYPTGGFSGLTNRGSFENLLTSELAYMGEGTEDVSLFDLRYVEGELLFYLRDSGNLRRKRRTVHFVIDLGLQFNLKSPGYDYQFSVLVGGLCVRLMQDLFTMFATDSLRFELHYLGADDDTALQEVGIMKVVLANYVQHGWVKFVSETSLKLSTLPHPKRKSYAVVFSSPDAAEDWETQLAKLKDEEAPLHATVIEVGGNEEDQQSTQLPIAGLPLQSIAELKNEVIRKLLD